MLVKEKTAQAVEILRETGIDCWLTFVRETAEQCDPAMELIAGCDVVGQGAFLLAADGRKIAVVASFDRFDVEALGVYDRVETYTTSLAEPLRRVLEDLAPRTIGLNYSPLSSAADGLTLGMYQRLGALLEGTPYPERFVSAEPVISRLRGRKTPEELRRMRGAIGETLELFDLVTRSVRPGWTMRRVAELLHAEMARRGLGFAWSPAGDPAVDSGPDVEAGHGTPPELPILPGHALHLDFGVRREGYSSDLQRMWYVQPPEEEGVPEELERALAVIQGGIRAAAAVLRPGVAGWEVDRVARQALERAGYPEFQHALGHQVGTRAHDGGTLLGPRWERYGDLVTRPVEEGQVYTLEFGVRTSRGYVGQEEMVRVVPGGCEFLSPLQEGFWSIPG